MTDNSFEDGGHEVKNPALEIIERNKPFVYFHTHVIDKDVLETAERAGKSLEVDMSVDGAGQVYIGHPEIFYTELKKIPLPKNLPLQEVLARIKQAGLYLVIDCKDEKALPNAKAAIDQFGAENVLFHSWVDALKFEPHPADIEVEPHWGYEDLPYDKVVELKSATGVPVIMSARGLTQERLRNERDAIVERIIRVAKGQATAVNFNLPNGEIPPRDIMDELIEQGILTWFNIDKIPPDQRPSVYLGMTDEVGSASNPKET